MPVAALVLGIVGLILSFVPCLGMYAIPLTILAIIFGVIGMKKEKGKGMAIAGLVCGIVGSLIACWWIYAYFTVRSEINDPNSEFRRGVQQFDQEMKKAGNQLDEDLKRAEQEMNEELNKTREKVDETAPLPE